MARTKSQRPCACGCGGSLPPRIGHRIYILGHSPHGHYHKKKRQIPPAPTATEAPTVCGKCGGSSLSRESVVPGEPITCYRCINCGWRRY